MQIASAAKVVAVPLVLFMEINHWSGASPVDEPIAELLMVTAVLVESVIAPPPVTTIPAGHVATASTCDKSGNAVSAEKA